MREKWWDFEISVILYSQCCCFLFYFKKIHFDFFHEHYKHYDVKQTKKNIPKYYQPNNIHHFTHCTYVQCCICIVQCQEQNPQKVNYERRRQYFVSLSSYLFMVVLLSPCPKSACSRLKEEDL